MKFTRRMVAILLCLMMVMPMLPMGVFAEADSGEVADIAAQVENASDRKVFHEHFDFETMGSTETAKKYMDAQLSDSGISYTGSDVWKYATEESGNTYLALRSADQTAFGFVGPDYFSAQPFELSFRIRMSYNEKSSPESIFFPLIRLSPGTSTSGSTTNALLIRTPKEADREGGKLLGTLRYTKGYQTDGESLLGSGYSLYADTWYSFRVVYDNAKYGTYTNASGGKYDTAKGYVYMAEEGGAEMLLGTVESSYFSTLNKILIGRGYSPMYLNVDLDDVRISSLSDTVLEHKMDVETDFGKLATDPSVYVDANGKVVDATAEGAVNPLTDVSFNASAGLPGLSMGSGSMLYEDCYPWYVGDDNGNPYLAKLADVVRPLNLQDTANVLKDGKFEISFDFLPGETMGSGGILALKDSSGSNGTSNAGESRILSVQPVGGVPHLVFGKSTSYPLCALTAGEWIRVTVTVDPSTSDYEVWANGELILFTRLDLAKTTDSTIIHKIWYKGSWGTAALNSTNTNFPFDADLKNQIKYIYLFHSYKYPLGLDNFRVRSMEKAPEAIGEKTNGTLYSMDFNACPGTVCEDCWTHVSTAGLVGISASSLPKVANGVLTNNKKGSAHTELALSNRSYTYLEDGILCIEGKLTPEAFSGNTGEFVFAALNRYLSGSIGVTANVVTVSADGKVSVGAATDVATLSTGATHTLKVYVDTDTMKATLFVDGARKALWAELDERLLLAPVIDTREILVPAIGTDGCVVTQVGNRTASAVTDYLRFDYGNQPAVLDTVTLFGATASTDTWGFSADDICISFEAAVDAANVALDFSATPSDPDIVLDGAVASGGVLKLSEGGSLKWTDSHLDTVTWLGDRGYTVELKLRADAAEGKKSLVQFVGNGEKKDILAIDADGKIIIGGDAKYPLASTASDEFTAVQLVFPAGTTQVGIFADGKFLGNVTHYLSYMNILSSEFHFLGGAEIDELKIHPNLVRDYAKESGVIFDWDMEYYTLSGSNQSPGAVSGAKPSGGVVALGAMSSFVVPTEENGETRSFLRRTGTKSAQTEIYASGHFSDAVTVLEATIRNTVPGTSSGTNIFRVRKGTFNGSDFIYLLNMDNVNGYLYYASGGTTYYLCDEKGNLYSANSATEWTTVAVVYDAIAATLRYTVNGRLAYCKTSTSAGAPIGFADSYAVNELAWNSLIAEEIRVRLYVNSGTGTLDLASYRAYEIDPSATAEIVGAQLSDTGDSIRVIAGVDMLHYGTVGFKAEYFNAEGKQVGDAILVDSQKVFTEISGGGSSYRAKDMGYRYLAAVAITDIASAEGSYRITPFTTLGGVQSSDAVICYGTPYTLSIDCATDTGIHYYEKKTPIAEAIYDTSEVVQFRGDGLSFNGIDAVFTFSALCKGEVSLDMVTARQVASVDQSVFELWVDGVKQDDLTLAIGHHSLTLAKQLPYGEHTFKLVKKTGGDYAHIYSITLDGTFTDTATAGRKNGVMLQVDAPAVGRNYGNFYVYTQTSDPTGLYYIKYNFMYELDDSYPGALAIGKSNTGYNRDNYRIKEAFLVKYDPTAGTFSTIWQVLHQGEISLAIKESGAADFIGGYHGDEKMESVELFMDGAAVDLTKASSLQTASKLIFKQTTILSSSDKPLQNVARHIQNYVIDSSGLRNRQQVEVLSNKFAPLKDQQVYLQMFTYYRTSGDTLLHDRVNLLDATGKPVTLTEAEIAEGRINTFKASDLYTAGADNAIKGSVNTRYMEYIGANDNGLYGKVGFNITDHSVTISNITGSIRRYNDVKWYPSFIGRKTTPVKGEVWCADLYYTIDYINPDNVEKPLDPPAEMPSGEAPAADVAYASGGATVTVNGDTFYGEKDSVSLAVVPGVRSGGVGVLGTLDSVITEANVGKTYQLSSYVYSETDCAMRMSVGKKGADVMGGSYHFNLVGGTWNRLTMAYTVTAADVANGYCAVTFDQNVSDALSAPSASVCSLFYVDDVTAVALSAPAESQYAVYTTEDFEDAPQKFSKYGVGTYSALTAADKQYMTGGQFSGITTVGALNWNPHTGSRALTVYPFGLPESGSFSGRIKLSHLLPDDIGKYLGYTFKISAYVMMDDMSAGDGTTISTNFGIMGDKTPNWKNATAVKFAEGEWTYVEHEVIITQSILDSLTVVDQDGEGNDRYYPARVFLDFGSTSNYPGVVYIDDITVEYQAPAAQ